MKKLSPLLFAFVLFSCKAIIKKSYGIKDPAMEDKQSILDYATKINLDNSRIVAVDSSAFSSTVKRLKGLPEAEIFNTKGENLEYRTETVSCNAGVFAFIPTLNKTTANKVKDNFSINELTASLRDLDGNKLTAPIDNTADYFLFIYWAKWEGKLNKDHVREWLNLAKANQNVKIQVFEVNMDFQKWWGKDFFENTKFSTKGI